jgi:uncharacterized membrane protein
MTQEQQLTANSKHTMLNPDRGVVQAVIVLGFMALVITILNYWSVQRDQAIRRPERSRASTSGGRGLRIFRDRRFCST